LTTLARLESSGLAGRYDADAPVITGAGSSAYSSCAIAAAWPDARDIATTELLLSGTMGLPSVLDAAGLVISIARSGDSPESVGVIELLQRRRPHVRHLAITCNESGRLAQMNGVTTVLLDQSTYDRSLAATNSFSNLTLAGLLLRHLPQLAEALPAISAHVGTMLPALDAAARGIAEMRVSRVAVLAPPALYGAAREACLKILEMTDGQVMAMPETLLGLRHGPLSFLRDDALVLCFLSTDPLVRRYEEDVLKELRAKKLGRIVGIAPDLMSGLLDYAIPASAPGLPDTLRTPFEIVFPQLLAYHLSLGLGLNPDQASPRRIISRVVEGVRIYES
jgi:tagatose-6-phosphate ketose/aldose isomerase